MDIKPIPSGLLCDSFTLIEPTSGGSESRTEISSVRVIEEESTERRSDRASHLSSEITVYYDCVQSVPTEVGFVCGQWIEWQGRRYEITKVRKYGLYCRHHFRLTAECRVI